MDNAAALHPLTAVRTARGWTLDRMAREIGVKRNTVWRWENGRMPRPEDWKRIETATGVTGAELAAWESHRAGAAA